LVWANLHHVRIICCIIRAQAILYNEGVIRL
jgi:hypothetical protein